MVRLKLTQDSEHCYMDYILVWLFSKRYITAPEGGAVGKADSW